MLNRKSALAVLASFALACMVVLTGCGSGGDAGPIEDAAKSQISTMVSDMSKGDYDNYFGSYAVAIQVGKNQGVDLGKVAECAVKHFTYEIKSATESGDTAKVVVSATNINIDDAYKELCSETSSMLGGKTPIRYFLTDGNFDKLADAADAMVSIVNAETETVTNDVELDFVKKDGQWQLDQSKTDWAHLLLAGQSVDNMK